MTRRNIDRRLALLGVAIVSAIAVPALESTAWQHRQTLPIGQAGLIKLALPPETLGRARAGLEDLRVLDPAGQEVPYALTRPAPAVPATTRAPAAFRVALDGAVTQLHLETGVREPLLAITLATPAPAFLKGARVEISDDGGRWETLAANTAIFRQFGAEHLRIDLQGRVTARVRVTIDDSRTRPVPFTGAVLRVAGAAAVEESRPIDVRLVRRDEFAGETVFTLDLGGAHVPLAGIEFVTAEPLFARAVTLAVRELRDEAARERELGRGTIWRVAGDGVPSTAHLEVAVRTTVPARELLVHVTNGDSPPLKVERISARQFPRWLVFRAAGPGEHVLLTGNPQISAPRYDLSALAVALRDTPASALVPGPATPNPGYRAADPLGGAALRGAALDVAPWAFRRAVQLATAGVQQLELDLEVLARAQAGLADLRLVRDHAQVPYLLERPPLSRTLPLEFQSEPDSKRPRVSRWRIRLPRAGAPVSRITLSSPTPLFQRDVRVVERIADPRRGETIERTLAAAAWNHRPGSTPPLTLALSIAPVGDVLTVETDNGDNPAIDLTAVQAAYPVARILFAVESGEGVERVAPPVALYYGNPKAAAPRYDLALLAPQILAAEKAVATLGAEEPAAGGSWAARLLGGGVWTGWVFWGALIAVVVGLLMVVAKLLPKPPAGG